MPVWFLVLTEIHLVCFCLCCVRVLSVWSPCVARFVCFAILGSSFPVVCMWGFCLETRGGLVFAVKLETLSLPQGWLLHTHCAAPLAVFSPYLLPSPSLALLWWSVFVGATHPPGHRNVRPTTETGSCHYQDTISKVGWSLVRVAGWC